MTCCRFLLASLTKYETCQETLHFRQIDEISVTNREDVKCLQKQDKMVSRFVHKKRVNIYIYIHIYTYGIDANLSLRSLGMTLMLRVPLDGD